jgi:hypothetical protein
MATKTTTTAPTAPQPAPRTVLFCPSVGDELIAEALSEPNDTGQIDLRLHLKGDPNDPSAPLYRDYLNVRRDYRKPGHMLPGTWQPAPEPTPPKSYPPPAAPNAKENQ